MIAFRDAYYIGNMPANRSDYFQRGLYRLLEVIAIISMRFISAN